MDQLIESCCQPFPHHFSFHWPSIRCTHSQLSQFLKAQTTKKFPSWLRLEPQDLINWYFRLTTEPPITPPQQSATITLWEDIQPLSRNIRGALQMLNYRTSELQPKLYAKLIFKKSNLNSFNMIMLFWHKDSFVRLDPTMSPINDGQLWGHSYFRILKHAHKKITLLTVF